MKRYFLVIISAIFSLGGMYADNISVTNIEIEAGETKTVSVCLENTETNLVGFQMDITLPEGITINKSGCALSSRFTDNDQELTIGKQAEGTYRLTSTSLSLNPISGTSGELLTIALTAGESTEGGTANFSNIRFVTSNSERITLSDVSFTISIAITNITFADENVKAICVANWDTNGDGELSYVEAAAVTSLNRVFNRNLEIKTFDELQYFTGLTSISTSQYDTDDFLGCTNLQSVILPPTINAIYGCSFNGTSIRTITLPKSVETIGTWAFQNCDKLVTIISENENVPNYLWSVNSGLFAGCHVLSSILVPSSAVEAYKGANGWKDYADKIKGIDDPISFADEYVKEICVANWDTNGDGELSYVEAAAVTDLGEVFKNNRAITSFDELQYFTGLSVIGNEAFRECSGLTSVTIPNSVTNIDNYAYYNCSSLTSVTIPNSVTSIGYRVFEFCSSLTSVTIPNSVTSIGYYAFGSCSGLTSVTIPNSVTSIEHGAFAGCSGLTFLIIPNSVTWIGESAFAACSGLTSIVVEDGNTCYDSRNNCNAIIDSQNSLIVGCQNTTIPNSVTSIRAVAFGGCTGLTSIIIPNSVTAIYNYAFDGCSGLTSVSIPNSVTSIGSFAFRNCSGLTSVTIPNSVTSIGFQVFAYCSGLTEVTIPNSVTSIGESAFEYCSGLTEVTIPNSVTSIEQGAFAGCGLQKVIVKDIAAWCNITFGILGNPLLFAHHLYSDESTEIKDLIIPNSVTSIGNHAFEGCSGLTSVTIPNSVTSIGDRAFYGCSGLTEITIPSSVTSIGDNAFNDCLGLISVKVEIDTPLTIDENTFSNRANCTLYVPTGSMAAYEAADYWKEFKEIVEMSSAVDDSNSLYADNITALIGNTASFSINMKNTESISGFQFTMTLPEGVSVATDGNGNLKATLSSRGSNAFFNANLASDGTYRCSSFLSNGSFSGEDGELVNFTLDIASDMAAGDYQVKLSNIELTTTSLEKINPSDVSATISVKDYDLGDANGDGGVSITDAVTIVYHINGIDVPNFIDAAADVNKDNSISITDAVSVVYIINGLYTASAKSLGGTTEPGPSYLTLSQKERNALSVGLMNSSEYTAFQMDVKLPETMNVENVVLNKERMGAHSVYFNRTDERTVRISCFSPRGECISNSMGEILQLVLSGNGSGEVSIDNILFTTTSLDEHELLSISTMATAISDVNMGNAMLLRGNTLVINSDEEKDLNIYTISGHLYRRVHLSVGMNKLEGFQRGVYVINGKKLTIK